MSLYNFVKSECAAKLDSSIESFVFYQAYQQWCKKTNFKPAAKKYIGLRLAGFGIASKTKDGKQYYSNIEFINPDTYDLVSDPSQSEDEIINNSVKDFINECCLRKFEAKTQSSMLYNAYTNWCFKSNKQPANQQQFKKELENSAFFQFRAGAGMFFRYIELKQ